MSNVCELNCQPAKNQLNKLIVPTHKEIAKQSVAYIKNLDALQNILQETPFALHSHFFN